MKRRVLLSAVYGLTVWYAAALYVELGAVLDRDQRAEEFQSGDWQVALCMN